MDNPAFSIVLKTVHGSLTFLLDTQAEISLIKSNALTKNVHIDEYDFCTLKGITKDQISSLGSCKIFLNLQNRYEVEQSFQVVSPSFPIPTHGILGKDFLCDNDCVIDALTNELTVRLLDNEIVLPMLKPKSSFITIPPRSQVIRKITLEVDQDVVINNVEASPGVFIASSISSKSKPYVSILNVTDVPQHLNVANIKYTPLTEFTSFKTNINSRNDLLQKSLNSKNIPSSIKQEFISLCEEFSDIFHLPGDKLSCNNFYEQEIKPTDDTPVFQKNFKIPHAQKGEIDAQIQEMLNNDVIESSDSPYNHQIFLVPKKSEEGQPRKWRLVVDFRKLNEKILPDRYPIPRIDEILDNLGNAKYFSTLDMQSGFHQIPLKESSRKYTAFSTPTGHYQFKRLPFGINICPTSFQRMVNLAMSGLTPDICFLYLDDIIIVGRSEKNHLFNLRKVFEKLKEKNLKLNPQKCDFFQKEVTFLGHKITPKGIFPDPTKIKIIKNYPRPKNAKETKRFVAFVNYYRKFIKNFSTLAEPLHKFSRKGVKFKWTPECEKSFEQLRDALCNPPILIYPNFEQEFILVTDASEEGCGAKLAQIRNGIEMPISFASMAFKKGDLNRPPIEKEMMAIYFGITHFRPYLYGKKFLIRTDHKPLIHLYSMKNPSPKILRMRLDLSEYLFDIEYIPGPENVETDALSRLDFKELTEKKILAVTRSMSKKQSTTTEKLNTDETNNQFNEPLVYEATHPNETKKLPKLKFTFSEVAIIYKICHKRTQLCTGSKIVDPNKIKDNALEELLMEIEKSAVSKEIKQVALRLDDDIFRYVTPTEFKTIGLKSLERLSLIMFYPRIKLKDSEEIQRILSEFHDHPLLAGHPGQQRMLEKLRNHYSWRHMKRDITQYVKSCEKCKLNKTDNHTKERFVITTTPSKPFDLILIDTIGPLPLTIRQNQYILSIQCDFSKYVIYVPLPNKEARTIASALVKNCILTFGPMKSIRSDRGKEYVNDILDKVCEILGIDKLVATAYHPQTIGSLERNHRVMNEYFRTSLKSMIDWDEWIQFFTFAYNTQPTTTHNLTPFELIYGRTANLIKDIGSKIDPIYNHESYSEELKYRLNVAFNKTRSLLLESKQKLINNQTKINPIDLKIGSKVKLQNITKNKFDHVYSGPYEVTKILESNVEILDSKLKTKQIVHKNRLSLY